MRLKMIWQLMRVNILYAGQAGALVRYRQRQAANPNKKLDVPMILIRQYLLVGAMYVFLFCFMNGFFQLAGAPMRFTVIVSVFVLMMLGQGFMTFYNVFYESGDLQAYRPYAYTEGEIMLAKLLSALMVILFTILPVLCYFILLAIQSPGLLVLTLPLALLGFSLILATIISLLIVLAHYLTKTTVFRQHKQLASNLLMALVMIITFWAVFQINGSRDDFSNLSGLAQIFMPFYDLVMNPGQISAWLGLLPWLAVLVALQILLRLQVVPQFYEAALTTSSRSGIGQRKSRIYRFGSQGRLAWVKTYVWRLVSEGSVLMQAILMSSIFPYIFLIAILGGLSEKPELLTELVQAHYLAPLMLLVIFIAGFNAGYGGLAMMGHSLERDNLAYIKTLPMDLMGYLKKKFWLLVGLQSPLALAILIGLCLFLGMEWWVIGCLILTWLVVSLAWSSWSYSKDYLEPVTQWSNVSELYSRGSTWVRSMLMLLGYIVTIGLVVGEYVLLMNLPEETGYLHALDLSIALLGVCGMVALVAWHRLAIQVRGVEAEGSIGRKWLYWPLAIALMGVILNVGLLPQNLAFNFLVSILGDQQTIFMLGTLVGGIIFVSVFLWLYYKHSGEKFQFGWKDLGISILSTIAMRIAISLLYGAMHSSQEMTGNDAALGGMLGVATEPSLWIAYFFISVIGPISEELVFRGYFKKLFCLNGHFGWFAALVSSALFGYMHGSSTLFEWLLYGGMSLGLYLSFRRRNQLIDSIALHIGNNLFVSVIQLLMYYGILQLQ